MEPVSLNEKQYRRFMLHEFSKFINDSTLLTKINKTQPFTQNIVERKLFITPTSNPDSFMDDFWINKTLEKDFNGDFRIFNLWTFKRAERLFAKMRFWQKIQQKKLSETEIIQERLEGKYPESKNSKKIVAIGDIHGDFHQLIFPLIKEGICKTTGKLFFYDTVNHRRANKEEIKNLDDYILLPEINFVRGSEKKYLVQLLGDIVDRGEWTDECWFLVEDLMQRAPKGLIKFVIGNHDASLLNDKYDLLSGYAYCRKKRIREG